MATQGPMRESIRRKGQGYQAVVFVGVDPVTGRKRYISRTFQTRREAEKWRDEVRSERRRTGTVEEPSKEPLGRYLLEWLGRKEAEGRSPATLSDYGVAIRRHILPRIGHLPLAALTPKRLQSFYDQLREEGLSSRVIRSVAYTLSSALGDAERLRLVPENPARRATPPKHTPKSGRALAPAELLRLLNEADRHRLRALWYAYAFLGLRRGEGLGLRWEDIDLDAEPPVLVVRREVMAAAGKVHVKEPKTRASVRVLPLPPEVASRLRAHREEQAREFGRLRARGHEPEEGWVFTSEMGTLLRPDNVYHAWLRICQRAGVSGVRLHDLRHSVSTLLQEAGVPALEVSAYLGHSRVSTTLGVYTHPLGGAAFVEAQRAFRRLLDRSAGSSTASPTD